MQTLLRDGISFNYYDSSHGTPFVFQHGLGGDVNQPIGIYHPRERTRLISMDCRGHGDTRPLGDASKLTITSFADDVIALLDYLKITQVIIGGISMGAAVALNIAVRYPTRTMALVLSRPAWLDQSGPANLAVYDFIAQLIQDRGPKDGLLDFLRSDSYLKILRESTDAANSLIRQFDHPRSVETVAKLERIPHCSPVSNLDEIRAIQVPTLVMANRQDPVHPFDYGLVLASRIPGAIFKELTPKSVSKERHAADVQTAIDIFFDGM